MPEICPMPEKVCPKPVRLFRQTARPVRSPISLARARPMPEKSVSEVALLLMLCKLRCVSNLFCILLQACQKP